MAELMEKSIIFDMRIQIAALDEPANNIALEAEGMLRTALLMAVDHINEGRKDADAYTLKIIRMEELKGGDEWSI